MKLPLTLLNLILAATACSAAVFSTNTPDKDAFVRELAPNSNYGGAGALSVSGTNATTGSPTNGAFDSFMSFNTASMVSNFNAKLGANNWVITSATLNLTENPSPGNAIFNDGTGYFQIRWIANDTWVEGSGNPMNPTTTGITYSLETDYLNTNADQYLGSFDFTGAAKLSYALALPNSFVTNMQAGGEVGLFMTAIDPQIGYVFYSRNYAGNPAALPSLVVSATSQPGLTGVSVSGPNLVLSATNGVAGGTYYVLAGTNLTSPPSQWTPVSTNILTTSGAFAVTVTNAAPGTSAGPQFFILQTQ